MPESEGREAPRAMRIDVRTRFGRLQGNLAVPPGGMRLSELAWNAMAFDERLVDMSVKAEAAQGREVSCRKGCGACCRQAVPLSPAEAWMIADVVAAMPAPRKGEVMARFTAAHARLQENGFGGRSLTAAGDEEMSALGLDYFRLGIACPFLEDDSCSIHPNRPSACREFLVSSPAELCSDPSSNEIVPIPTAASLTDALSRLSAMVMGGEPRAIPMTLALEWAAANRDAGRKRYDPAQLMGTLFDLLTAAGEAPGAETAGGDGPAPESPG